jgi:hypothetical protein
LKKNGKKRCKEPHQNTGRIETAIRGKVSKIALKNIGDTRALSHHIQHLKMISEYVR